MMSLHIGSFPEGWTSTDSKFLNQLTALVGEGDEMKQEEKGFIGDEIVTPPLNTQKRSSSFSDNGLKAAKAIKFDFNSPQQTLNQSALIMSVGVEQQKQGSSIADENLEGVSTIRPNFVRIHLRGFQR